MPFTSADRAVIDSNKDTDTAIRRGRIFSVRLEPEEERTLRERMAAQPYHPWEASIALSHRRAYSFGAFIIKSALAGSAPPAKPAGVLAGKTKRRPPKGKTSRRRRVPPNKGKRKAKAKH